MIYIIIFWDKGGCIQSTPLGAAGREISCPMLTLWVKLSHSGLCIKMLLFGNTWSTVECENVAKSFCAPREQKLVRAERWWTYVAQVSLKNSWYIIVCGHPGLGLVSSSWCRKCSVSRACSCLLVLVAVESWTRDQFSLGLTYFLYQEIEASLYKVWAAICS